MKINLLNLADYNGYIEKIKEITLRNPGERFNTKSIAKEIINTREIENLERCLLLKMTTRKQKSNHKKKLELIVTSIIEDEQFIEHIRQKEKWITVLHKFKNIFFLHSKCSVEITKLPKIQERKS